jgi:hypothetical protein
MRPTGMRLLQCVVANHMAIPFSTFRGQLKQLETSFKLPIMRDFFDSAFSAFAGTDEVFARFKREGVEMFANAAGMQPNFGGRPRRFAGGPGLPPDRYFVVCDGSEFRDRGTLRDELTSYYGGDPGVTVTIFDPKVESSLAEELAQSGSLTEEQLKYPFYYMVYRIEQATSDTERLIQRHGLKRGANIAITYGVRQFDASIENVIDLRVPTVQEWFTQTFVGLEIANEEAAAKETNIYFPPKKPISTFGELLPVIISLETGGGTIFSQAIGQWLRQNGANGLIFPSARSNSFVKVSNGVPTEWGGWNLVIYDGATDPVSERLFGRMTSWRDRDHDHIAVNYDSVAANRGSFSVRGVREFNLLRFELEKQVACGLRQTASDVAGVIDWKLSRAVKRILADERKQGTLWFHDVDYIEFLAWHEEQWRKGAGDSE